MTTDQIDRLINRREKLTNRRDGRLNRPALDEIDAKLSQVPPGADNRVDKLLGRPCAVLPAQAEYGPQLAPSDYRIANRPDNPNWHGVAAWFDEAAQGVTAAQAEQYRLEAEGQPDGIVDHDDAQAGAWM